MARERKTLPSKVHGVPAEPSRDVLTSLSRNLALCKRQRNIGKHWRSRFASI